MSNSPGIPEFFGLQLGLLSGDMSCFFVEYLFDRLVVRVFPHDPRPRSSFAVFQETHSMSTSYMTTTHSQLGQLSLSSFQVRWMSMKLQLDVCRYNQWWGRLVKAYTVESGMVPFAGKSVWSIPERLEGEVLTVTRYINPRTFTLIRTAVPLRYVTQWRDSGFAFPSPSPLSSSITPSLFHSRLKTYLFNRSFPP